MHYDTISHDAAGKTIMALAVYALGGSCSYNVRGILGNDHSAGKLVFGGFGSDGC